MNNTKRRVGILLPSANNVLEPEIYTMSPKVVTYHTARLYNKLTDVRELLSMLAQIERSTKEVISAGCELILYACTSGSFAKGAGYDQEVVSMINRHAPGIPVVTAAGALIEALSCLKLRRVAVCTPYLDEVNEQARNFLQGNGVTVLSLKGLQITHALAVGDVLPDQVLQLAIDVDRLDAEGIVISCTNLRTTEVIDELEALLGKPVITSNQASLWAVLRRLSVNAPVMGYGRLLRHGSGP